MLPQKLSLPLMQTTWAQQLDPIIANPILDGVQQNNVVLAIGDNAINHKLQRKPQGYIIVGMRNAYSQIIDVVSQTPNLTLILNSSAATTVDIYVY